MEEWEAMAVMAATVVDMVVMEAAIIVMVVPLMQIVLVPSFIQKELQQLETKRTKVKERVRNKLTQTIRTYQSKKDKNNNKFARVTPTLFRKTYFRIVVQDDGWA